MAIEAFGQVKISCWMQVVKTGPQSLRLDRIEIVSHADSDAQGMHDKGEGPQRDVR